MKHQARSLRLRRTRIAVVAILTATAWGCSGSQAVAPPAPSIALSPAKHRVTISQFADLPVYYDYYGPSAVAAGPGRSLWVTDTIDQDFGENAVIEVALSGKARKTFYYSGQTSEGSDLIDLAEGSDGALWITDEYNSQILRMTTGGSFTAYPLDTSPWYVTQGPDKALWFTENSGIGRITTSGTVSQYAASGFPWDICVGPDGALWFTEPDQNVIGRITTHGKIKYYSKGISSGAYPYSIAAGPDGALWFTEYDIGRIGRITTSGKVTEYSNGITSGELPIGIAQGPDDAMWFTESESRSSYQSYNGKIARITPGGSVTEYDKFNTQSDPTIITEGADKNMWFTESASNEMGRVNL
jgi:virginiamycin B lyase